MIHGFESCLSYPLQQSSRYYRNGGCTRIKAATVDYLDWLLRFRAAFDSRAYDRKSLRTLVFCALEDDGGRVSVANAKYTCHTPLQVGCDCHEVLYHVVESPKSAVFSTSVCNKLDYLRSCEHWQEDWPGFLCLDCIKTQGQAGELDKCAVKHYWKWEEREEKIKHQLVKGLVCG